MQNNKKIFILFGATGDLAREKILPALFSLYNKEENPLQIIAVSRRPYSQEEYRAFLKAEIKFSYSSHSSNSPQNRQGRTLAETVDNVRDEQGQDQQGREFESFFETIHYISGDFKDTTLYGRIFENLMTISAPSRSNLATSPFRQGRTLTESGDNVVVSYLATAPQFYGPIIEAGHQAGLWGMDKSHRVLIEKPYAENKEMFARLEHIIETCLGERVLLVDHYLGKYPVRLFENMRKNNLALEQNIQHELCSATVYLFEKNDVDRRGEFYDAVGAFMDVGANHALQCLLTTIAPHNNKKLFLESLSSIEATRFQYQDYYATQHVDPHSQTETAFSVTLQSSLSAFQDTNIRLVGGKGFDQYDSGIKLVYKDGTETEIGLKPEEYIVSKEHEIDMYIYDSPDAYETIIQDAYTQKPTYFVEIYEGFHEWRIGDQVKKLWQDQKPIIYPKGAKRDVLW